METNDFNLEIKPILHAIAIMLSPSGGGEGGGFCLLCHSERSEESPQLFLPFAGSDSLLSLDGKKQKSRLASFVGIIR